MAPIEILLHLVIGTMTLMSRVSIMYLNQQELKENCLNYNMFPYKSFPSIIDQATIYSIFGNTFSKIRH